MRRRDATRRPPVANDDTHTAARARPPLGGRFDTAFAIDVNAFWTTPAASLAALQRLLEPAGTAHLVYQPPTPARLRALERSLPVLLREAGFRVADVRVQPFRTGSGLCIIGRPASADSGTV